MLLYINMRDGVCVYIAPVHKWLYVDTFFACAQMVVCLAHVKLLS